MDEQLALYYLLGLDDSDFAKMRKDKSALVMLLEKARSRLHSHPVLDSIRKEIDFLY